MRNNSSYLSLFLVLVLLVFQMGCAYINQDALINPNPIVLEGEIGAGKEIALTIRDEREDEILGHRGSALIKGAKITTEQNISDVISNAIRQGLINKGFKPVAWSENLERKLLVEVRSIEYSTSTGFWTGGVFTKVALKGVANNGASSYEEFYRVNNEKRVLLVPFASKNEELINSAISQGLEQLLNDKKLLEFLAK